MIRTEEYDYETVEQIEEAKQLLADDGFQLTILGCGCCGSPRVKLSHNGKDVIFESDFDVGRVKEDITFSMHDL